MLDVVRLRQLHDPARHVETVPPIGSFVHVIKSTKARVVERKDISGRFLGARMILAERDHPLKLRAVGGRPTDSGFDEGEADVSATSCRLSRVRRTLIAE